MKALLRADWLRLRRRRDLWIIAIAVCVIGCVTFLSGYRSDASDPTWLITDPVQVRQEVLGYTEFEGSGMTQAEIDAQIDQIVADQIASNQQQLVEWEAQQRITLQRYGFPQSVFTVVGSGVIPVVALVLISSLAVGDEFRYGTIRTSFLAASNRRRFLVARLLSLLALTVGLFVVLLVLGTLLGAVLALVGADLGANTLTIHAPSAVAWLGAQLLTTFVMIVLAIALTVLLRSGALTVLLIVLGSFIELFIAHLPIFAPTELLSGVPQAFLLQNVTLLTGRLGLDTGALALVPSADLPHQSIAVPMVGVAAVVVGWGILFLLIADRRLRTMDVVE